MGSGSDSIVYHGIVVDGAAIDILRFVQYLEIELGALENGFRKLAQCHWNSDARDAFLACHEQWTSNARAVAEQLISLESGVRDGKDEMLALDAALAQALG